LTGKYLTEEEIVKKRNPYWTTKTRLKKGKKREKRAGRFFSRRERGGTGI